MNGRKALALRREIYGDQPLQVREQRWSISKIIKTGKTDSKGEEVVVRTGTVRCVGHRAALQAAKRERRRHDPA